VKEQKRKEGELLQFRGSSERKESSCFKEGATEGGKFGTMLEPRGGWGTSH
jgi:hypothetical protein